MADARARARRRRPGARPRLRRGLPHHALSPADFVPRPGSRSRRGRWLVSEDAAITGHAVHGIRVVGTCRELPALIARHRVDVVYLVEAVAAAEVASYGRMLEGLPVRLVRWDIVETDVPLHG